MNQIDLKPTDLTGLTNRSVMNDLAAIFGEPWLEYRAEYDRVSALGGRAFPIQLDLELNASCNLRCAMCPISVESPKNKGPSTWFDFELYKSLIDFAVANGTKAVKLNYVNEPLIRKDFVKFVRYAKQAGILNVYFSTNGVLLTKPLAVELIEAGLTKIQISIDATTREVYDVMRPGGDFEKVLRNVEMIRRERDTLGEATPLVRVNFVKTELNEHQLEEFLATWEGRVDQVGVQEFIKPTAAAREIYSSRSTNKQQSSFRCAFPFRQLVVTNEKKVLPCCTFWGEQMPLGTLETPEQLLEFWTGDRMRYLRQMHLEGRYREIPECRQCVDGGCRTNE
jgi:uncharacterized radical SAM superfamily Fe-S cluster-containing enzyme